MQQMPEEELSLVQDMRIYDCHRCMAPAQHPVLPPCGHLHCWKCLHRQSQCPACGQYFNEDLFALFIDHGALQAEGLPLPPKPRARHSERIRNSGSLQGLPNAVRNQDNLAEGVQLAGYGLFPPLAINSLNMMRGDTRQQDALVKLPWHSVWAALAIILVLIVWLA